MIQENDQRRQLEEKRKKREEAKKAAEEAKRKKMAAKGEAPTDEPEEPEEETCVIDNLLKEIRAGTTLRRTGQNSVHRRKRQTSQLNKGDLERLNQIVEKATASPRKSLTPVPGYESQFKFPVVDEENENESAINKVNGVETPNDSAKVSNDGTKVSSDGAKATADNMKGINSKKVSNADTALNGQGINSETDVAPLPNGENHAILKSEAKIDRQGRDLSVSQPQHLTSPAVGDTATNSQSLPVSPAKDQLDEGLPILETVTRGPHRETKPPEKQGTGSVEKKGARSLKKKGTETKEKEGMGSLEREGKESRGKVETGSPEKEETASLEKDGNKSSSETSLNLMVSCT